MNLKKNIILAVILPLLVGCVSRYHDKAVYHDLLQSEKQKAPFATHLKELPEYDPHQFIGRGFDDIKQELGAPDFIRRDQQKEFLQYRGKDCIIDLFTSEDRVVIYVKLRTSSRDSRLPPRALRQCLYLLVEQRKQASQS